MIWVLHRKLGKVEDRRNFAFVRWRRKTSEHERAAAKNEVAAIVPSDGGSLYSSKINCIGTKLSLCFRNADTANSSYVRGNYEHETKCPIKTYDPWIPMKEVSKKRSAWRSDWVGVQQCIWMHLFWSKPRRCCFEPRIRSRHGFGFWIQKARSFLWNFIPTRTTMRFFRT